MKRLLLLWSIKVWREVKATWARALESLQVTLEGFVSKRANFAPVSVNSSIVRFFIQFPRDMSLWKADKRWNSFLECGRSLYNSCKGNANVQVSLAAVINPDRHLCLPLFSCFGREDSAPSSSPCPCAHNVGKTGEEAFPCCPPVWGMWVKMCFGETLSPPCSCLVPGGTVLLPFPRAQLCAPLIPGTISGNCCWADSAHESGRNLGLFFFPFFFLGLVFCQLSGLLIQVSTFPATKDLFFWHS